MFETFIKVSITEFVFNPLNWVSLPGYTWQCVLKYSGTKLQKFQGKYSILTLEINIHGGISSDSGDRYVKSDENKKILYMDANNLHGRSMIQPLPYDEMEMCHGSLDLYRNKIEEISNTPDDLDIGYFVEGILSYTDKKKKKQRFFKFVLKIKLFLKINLMII